MKKKKQPKIKKPRNTWEINPRTRIHSDIGYNKKDRRKNKNIKPTNSIDNIEDLRDYDKDFE